MKSRVLNFRLGKGMLREQRKALSPASIIKAMRILGIPEEEIKSRLLQVLGSNTRPQQDGKK